MITVGLLGPPGAGKSTVAHEFARLGAGVFDADAAVHRALEEPEVRAALVRVLGGGICGVDGGLDRKRIAAMVFQDDPLAQARRRYLERILHRRAEELCLEQQAVQASQGVRVFVIDAPLLLEAGWSTLCQRLICIDAPTKARYDRVALRGWMPRDVEGREKWLLSPAAKRVRADFVIENRGSLDELRQRVADVFHRLLANSVSES